MSEINDNELLAEFAQTESEATFTSLVARHINLVYSAVLRFTRNPNHAEEVTQVVFTILARKATTLGPNVVLSGWLYQTVRLTSANFLRSEIRRQRREQEAYMQSTLKETDANRWEQIAPLLDEAMGKLGETDRNAIVLRFFENKSGSEVARALKMNEGTAHKRVSRALEKLHTFFVKRGVVTTTAIIAGVVSTNSVQAAPAALAASISAAAITRGAAGIGSTLTLIKTTLKIMAWSKIKTALVVGAVVILTAGTATTTIVVKHYASPRTIRVRAYIDGTDIIKIQGKKIWYEHLEFNLPGDPNSRKEPTTINGFEWRPQWQEQTSSTFENLTPAFKPGSLPQVKLTKLLGRGVAVIQELPTPENNGTLSLYFHDEDPGADWYEVVVEWKP
jgi:RNA polymerase sigma factor (sigma-70 family)